MTTPEYIATPHQPPHHRGNTNASQERPWYGPTNDQERLGTLQALGAALSVARAIASGLGTKTDDYETSIRCVLDRVSGEKRAILEGCK